MLLRISTVDDESSLFSVLHVCFLTFWGIWGCFRGVWSNRIQLRVFITKYKNNDFLRVQPLTALGCFECFVLLDASRVDLYRLNESLGPLIKYILIVMPTSLRIQKQP